MLANIFDEGLNNKMGEKVENIDDIFYEVVIKQNNG